MQLLQNPPKYLINLLRHLLLLYELTSRVWARRQWRNMWFPGLLLGLAALNACSYLLADNPLAGRERNDVHPGYRSFPEGSHIIFYIVNDESVDIIGIPSEVRFVLAPAAGG